MITHVTIHTLNEVEVGCTTFVTTFACNGIIMQVQGDITFFILRKKERKKRKENSNCQHSLLDNKMLSDFET